MHTKLKQMRAKVKEELDHIPDWPSHQGELRMVYWSRRMRSLGKKATNHQSAKEVLEDCMAEMKREYQIYDFKFDREFFNS